MIESWRGARAQISASGPGDQELFGGSRSGRNTEKPEGSRIDLEVKVVRRTKPGGWDLVGAGCAGALRTNRLSEGGYEKELRQERK